MRPKTNWGVATFLAMALIISGCRSMEPSVSYYTLSPIAPPAAQMTATTSYATVIGIRPVDVPGVINRVQMVTRSGPHQLSISSLHRWADYPNQMVQQIIGEDLQTLMPDARVISPPWPMGLKPDVAVTVKFYELIGVDDKQVLLNAGWTIVADDPLLARSHRISLTEPIMGKGYHELAAAHSRILTAFCRQLADSLKSFRG